MQERSQEKSTPTGNSPPSAWSFWRQASRLTAVSTSSGFAVTKFRSLKRVALSLAVFAVISVAFVSSMGAADVADIVALRYMAYSCWSFGGLGLLTLLHPGALQDEPNALARLRGQDLNSPLIQMLSFSRRLTTGMWLGSLPGLIAALALSSGGSMFVQRGLLVLAAAIYLFTLGVLLGTIGTVSARARSPRLFALSLILAPFFLSLAHSEIPSIPGTYIWMFGEMVDWGGSVS